MKPTLTLTLNSKWEFLMSTTFKTVSKDIAYNNHDLSRVKDLCNDIEVKIDTLSVLDNITRAINQ
jgi:hypothetical protein